MLLKQQMSVVWDRESIGNDIVDLQDQGLGSHPRFAKRVLSSTEYKKWSSGGQNIWAYWAAKEAAYKSLKRLNPALVFSPKLFEFNYSESVVSFSSCMLPCKLEFGEAGYVFAVCCTFLEILKSERLNSWIGEAGSLSGSVAVRTLARSKISKLLGHSEDDIDFLKSGHEDRRGIPILQIAGVPVTLPISFTHHGRFVGCSVLK